MPTLVLPKLNDIVKWLSSSKKQKNINKRIYFENYEHIKNSDFLVNSAIRSIKTLYESIPDHPKFQHYIPIKRITPNKDIIYISHPKKAYKSYEAASKFHKKMMNDHIKNSEIIQNIIIKTKINNQKVEIKDYITMYCLVYYINESNETCHIIDQYHF